jgi:2-keto-4-pentenoate hydratase/2-oxohepta-3-ene-1,7-dioic acid hydratase in catechol pathway
MKILAVGMNYAAHNKELNEALLPKEPVIFSKPDSALLRPGRPFFVPDFAKRFDYEAELVVRISRIGKDISERYAHRYYDAVTVGIDFTARDLQSQLRNDGLPWELCKGFDGSAALGTLISKQELFDIPGCTTVEPEWKSSKTGGSHISEACWQRLIQDIRFQLDIDGTTVQKGHTADMMFSVDRIISYVSRFITLKTGDLIFTGTPMGVGPVHEGQTLKGYIGKKEVLNLRIR